ncbi:MAG: hypothetical protein WC833_08560 [Bacteroidales bacterium]|jgi:hypothetical protein
MKSILYSLVCLLFIFSCSKKDVKIDIGPDIINPNYLGNGAEWDPYCEAEMWGTPVTEEMWKTIFERTDYMKMSIVRCMINSPFRYYNNETGEFERDRNIESLKRMLSYCQKNNITVMYGEFNPPSPALKNDMRWISMSVKYLNYLVVDCGFNCIKYFIPANEPDGSWSFYDGNYESYKDLISKFHKEMMLYPELSEHIKFAAPDVVLGYKNPKYDMQAADWVAGSARDIDSLVGVYEIHTYPGYKQVRDGSFSKMLKDILKEVPAGKQLIIGEAGYKAGKEGDSLENRIHKEKLDKTPLITNKEGADCNMRVYDFEYGLDMALLAMEVMNNGGSGVAAWMLDDSHSVGDRGDTANVKIWGMWNIFGLKIRSMKNEENLRPWYYAWSLMCRYFPAGSNILKTSISEVKDLNIVASVKDGKLSIAFLNRSSESMDLNVSIPGEFKEARVFRYEKENMNMSGESLKAEKRFNLKISGKSLVVITDLN